MATSINVSVDRSVTPRRFEGFPIGYYDDIHPDDWIELMQERDDGLSGT